MASLNAGKTRRSWVATASKVALPIVLLTGCGEMAPSSSPTGSFGGDLFYNMTGGFKPGPQYYKEVFIPQGQMPTPKQRRDIQDWCRRDAAAQYQEENLARIGRNIGNAPTGGFFDTMRRVDAQNEYGQALAEANCRVRHGLMSSNETPATLDTRKYASVTVNGKQQTAPAVAG